jgi:hypothetical protein
VPLRRQSFVHRDAKPESDETLCLSKRNETEMQLP